MARIRNPLALLCGLAFTLAACGEVPPPTGPTAGSAYAKVPAGGGVAMLAAMNDGLASRGRPVRVGKAELLIANSGGLAQGQEIFANDRTHVLPYRWVPGDARRGALGSALTYIVDQSDGVATAVGGTLSNAQTEAAIDRAMHTWDVGTQCSALPLVKVSDDGSDFDLTDALLGFGGFDGPRADIVNAGWMPAAFFDVVAPSGSSFILGVTFTFYFVEQDGVTPTDINRDRRIDTAFKETYYNNSLPWKIDTGSGIDVESVALHENGHGLELAHIGKIFATLANGELHFAPRAVMNAAYSGVQQVPTGLDLAGHCANFGKWPNQ